MYFDGIAEILLEQHGPKADNGTLNTWVLAYHLQNSLDLNSVSFDKVNPLLYLLQDTLID